jgi:hypothetical protein
MVCCDASEKNHHAFAMFSLVAVMGVLVRHKQQI